MKYVKTIIFLSPIPWLFHNRQIALYARDLSKFFNVIYVDCSSVGNNSISITELLQPSKIHEYGSFRKNIKDSRISLINKPRFITLKKYKPKENLGIIDKYLFINQIIKAAINAKRKKTVSGKIIIWTSTLQFDESWKRVTDADWVFDYFDRFPIPSEEIKRTEKWLLEKSNIVFVNSDYYEQLAKKAIKNPGKIIRTPVGYYLDPYIKIKPKRNTNRLTVGYGGGISDRLNFPLIIDSVKLNPEIQFVFAGPVYEKSFHNVHKSYSTTDFVQKLQKFNNVKLLPTQRGPKGIIRVMSGFDIGWIPYDIRVPFNKFSTPTKFYEYCAFGIPTVSTRMEIMNEHKDLVYFLDSPQKLKDIVKKAMLQNTDMKIKLRKKYAADNDIAKKSKLVFHVLEKL